MLRINYYKAKCNAHCLTCNEGDQSELVLLRTRYVELEAKFQKLQLEASNEKPPQAPIITEVRIKQDWGHEIYHDSSCRISKHY